MPVSGLKFLRFSRYTDAVFAFGGVRAQRMRAYDCTSNAPAEALALALELWRVIRVV